MTWIWTVAAGLALMPAGAIAGLAAAYLLLMLSGVTEHEGRRGLLAGVYGIVPGAIFGFWAGHSLLHWLISSRLEWRSTLAGCALGALLAVTLGLSGLLAGIPIAESRSISNYAGERAAWSLFHVAFPLAAAGGIGGFLLGCAVA